MIKLEDANNLVSMITKTVLVSLTGLIVTYLKNIGDETTKININMTRLESRVETFGVKQTEVDKNHASRFDRVEKRLDKVEEKIQ